MENKDEDYIFATKLQQQFDEELLEVSSGDDDVCFIDAIAHHDNNEQIQSKHKTGAVELLTDSDDDISHAQIDTTSKAKLDLKPHDLNHKEYFIEELHTYVDPEYNFEWKFINVLPDISALFEKFDELFFQSRFKAKKFKITWSEAMGSTCLNRNYNDDEGRYTIALNATLLVLRPRILIISVILHEMIHAFLKMECIIEPNNGHGDNFRKIMIHLNTLLHTNISFNHKLNDTSLLCRTQWYRCTGICHNYKPFHGIVRSIHGPPGLHDEWWKEHADSCGGTFYKIYEMRKKVGADICTRYAVNVKYMVPKRENIRGRWKTTVAPKESIDLTADIPRIIPVVGSEIITVDTENYDGSTMSSVVADKFIECFSRTIPFTRDVCEMQCPICQERVKRKLFSSHIDGCKGFVRHVSWKKSINGTIVQNGLLELKVKPGLRESADGQRIQSGSSMTPSSSSFYRYQQTKRKRFG